MNISFENKVALVTGAASGMGLTTARAFVEKGSRLLLAGTSEVLRCLLCDAEARRCELGRVCGLQRLTVWLLLQTVCGVLRVPSGSFQKFLAHDETVYYQCYSHEQR